MKITSVISATISMQLSSASWSFPHLSRNVGCRDMKSLKFFIIFLFVDRLNAEVFSAIEELDAVAQNEEFVIKEFGWLIETLERTIVGLKNHVKNIEKEQENMKAEGPEYILNPLNAFLLIKRLSFDLAHTINHFVGISEQFKSNTEHVRLEHSEFEGAVEGLLRLQLIYDLKAEDLAKGIIQGQKYREDLTAKDLFSIGEELLNSQSYAMSLSYLNLALEKNKASPDMSPLAILESIYRNYNETDNKVEVINTIDKILELAPERSDLENTRNMLELENIFAEEPVKDEVVDLYAKDGQFSTIKEFKLVSDTCSGKVQRPIKELSELHCRFISTTAFTIIAPFKMEEMNLEPLIALYHDVISESEIEVIKSTSKPSLFRAQTLNKDATSKATSIRVAKLSWHTDSSHHIYDRLTKRVGDMTGLNMETAEQWQAQNYGIGGHYDAHWDFVTKDAAPFSTGNGNRVATALFYLTDVEKGGETVFPYLGIKVTPKKKSAVFWYNMSTSGDLEFYTRHSACPVLVGSKWVANKWIHEHGQEFTRPCDLEPAYTDEEYYLKVF